LADFEHVFIGLGVVNLVISAKYIRI